MADTQPSSTTSPATVRVESVQLSLLAPDPEQIRKHFDESALASLAESIKAQGLIQPIVVRPKLGNGTDYDYKIVAGERRYRAAQLAGIEHVPVIVRTDLANADIAVLQVLENLQRENLTLSETCAGVAKLVDTLGFAKTCQQLGKSEAWVSKHAGVLKLRPEIVSRVIEGKIDSVDIARELHALADLDAQQYEKLMGRYMPPEEAPSEADEAVQADTLPEPAATADLEDDRAQATWQARRNAPPTRAEIRAAIFEARAQQLADAEEAQQLERRSAMQAQAAQRGTEQADDDDDPDFDGASRENRAPDLAGESAAERERRIKREKLDALIVQGDKFCAEQIARLAELVRLPAQGQRGPDDEPEYVTIHTPHHWQLEEAGATDTLTIPYAVKVSAPVTQSVRVLHALGVSDELTIELDSLTLNQVEAIAKIIGRDFNLCTHRKLSGHQIFKALVAARARANTAKPKPAIAAKTKAKGQGTSAEQDDAPQGIAAFLKACVRKARVPGKRLAPADLHAAYIAWCKTQKRKPVPIKDKRWGQAVAAAGIEKVRSNGFWYVGIEVVKP